MQQYLDLLRDVVDNGWLAESFDKTVRTRGKAIINARGKSSAASAAARRPSDTTSCGTATSTGRSTTEATAPRATAGSPGRA